MKEPPRISDINSLNPAFREKLILLLKAMEIYGFRPQVFEAKRTLDRQKWLYGVGRTHDLSRKPITWTLKSNHISGNAADVVEAVKLWSNPRFFIRLKSEAQKLGLHTIPQEGCHIEL